MYTEEVNKTALSSNNDKRLQTFDRITTYPYGTNAFKVCESEMLTVKDLFFEKLQRNSVTTINIKKINFDGYVNENTTEHNNNWPFIPGSSILNISNRRFRIWRNECIIEFDRKPTRHR